MTSIKQVTIEDLKMVNRFLSNAGDLSNFRYFRNRSLESIKNHLHTCVLLKKNTPVGYGHLDPENGKVWLGMAIGDSHRGGGLGKILLKHLIDEAKKKQIDKITLSVDKDNLAAIRLYEKFGFKQIKDEESYFLYELDLNR